MTATDDKAAVTGWVERTNHFAHPDGPVLHLADVRAGGCEVMVGDFEFAWCPLGVPTAIPSRPYWAVVVHQVRADPGREAALVEVRPTG